MEAGHVSGWERFRTSEEQEPQGQEEAGRLLCCRDPSCGSLPSSRETDLCLSLLPGGYRAAGGFPGASSSGEAVVQHGMCLGTPQGAEPSHPGTIGAALGPEPSLSVPISSHTPPTNKHWELPGGPVANTPPSKAGGAGLVPGRGDKIPHACGPNTENRSNIVRDSVKTLRLVHIQKSKQGKCRCLQALASCPALGVPPAPTPGHLAGLSSGAEWHGGTGTWSTVSTAGSRQA